MRRRSDKSELKSRGLTSELALILFDLNLLEVGGIYDVAVKCIDIIKNTDSEGSHPGLN